MVNLLSISFKTVQLTGNDFTVALVGYIVVFVALLLLFILFKQIPRVLNMQARRRMRRKGRHQDLPDKEMHLPGDVNAAIAMALVLYFEELHDEEDMILTLKRVKRRYSPWSSKIYSVLDFSNR